NFGFAALGAASSGFAAEVWHRVAQDVVDDGALLTGEALFQPRQPAAHGFDRWADRPRRHDAGDADLHGRLLAGKQEFLWARAEAGAGEHDVDVLAGLEAGEADHALGKVDDAHRLPHVEHVYGDAHALRPGRVARRGDDEIAGFADGHEVAHHVTVRDGHRA